MRQPRPTHPPYAARPTVISRRTLLAGAAGLTLASCAPSAKRSTIQPPFILRRPATLASDPTVPPLVGAAALRLAQGQAGLTTIVTPSTPSPSTPTPPAPDLLLTYTTTPTGYHAYTIGRSPLAAITSLRTPLDGLTADQAHALFTASLTDWRSVGAPAPLRVSLHALATLPLPPQFTPPVGATPPTLTLHPHYDALLTAVSAQPGSLALVPLEALDWPIKNLALDGVAPAQNLGDPTTSPAGDLPLRLCVSPALHRQGLDGAKLAQALSAALWSTLPTLDLAVVGDIMLGRGVNNKMLAHGDYAYPYHAIHDELHRADLRLANLECTLTDLVPVPTDPSTFTFVSASKAIDGLTYAGFDALTVANNHADGPGIPALLDMLHALQRKGIATCGGGATLSEARQPAILNAKGLRLAILGYDAIPPQGPYATAQSGGLAPLDLTTLPADLAAARANADLVIPYFHWGVEYTKVPTREQQTAARAAIDAGADLVLGNHPHWTQGIENYNGKLIIYSMGNFIFDQDWSRPTMEGMLLHLYWRGPRLISLRLTPTIDQDRCQPRIMSPAEATDLFDRLWSGTDRLASGEYGPEYEP